jgi:Flp pilus assembly protein TadD
VEVGPDAFKDGQQALGAWIAYGAAKANAYHEHPLPSANESADDFSTELAGREAQSAIWPELRQKGAPPHAFLDKQVEIARAGFLPELVLTLNARPGWTVPASALAKLRFQAFVERFSGDYPTGAPVVVKPPSGKLWPDVPGGDFPDPATLPFGSSSCAREIDARKEAWNHFASIEKRLGGAPVAASSALEFAHQLMAAQTQEPYKTRGVTWVSARVGYLAALDGFCAVERKDWAEAIRSLTRASLLMPDNAQPRLELALALTASKRHLEALAQVNRAQALTKDGCVVGLAWRRRGYILIELGALDAAQSAYETSLKYDAQNPAARNELDLIARMRRERRGGSSDPAVPPMSSPEVSISECRIGGRNSEP